MLFIIIIIDGKYYKRSQRVSGCQYNYCLLNEILLNFEWMNKENISLHIQTYIFSILCGTSKMGHSNKGTLIRVNIIYSRNLVKFQ